MDLACIYWLDLEGFIKLNVLVLLQWKIRYTLASSLHEIARVIGPELAERDLVPFFNALVKDVDEVRVGILKNLANFIKVRECAFVC